MKVELEAALIVLGIFIPIAEETGLIDEIQGYYFSKLISASEIERLYIFFENE